MPSSINSMIRLTGMSSGLDTDTIIKSLMSVEQAKVDKVIKAKKLLEWKKESQEKTRSLISAFRTSTMSVLSPDTNMNTANAYNTYKITLATSTNAVRVTAATGAMPGQHTINSITRIATAASSTSSTPVTSEGTVNLNTTLENLSLSNPLQFGGTESDTLSFTINDKEFVFKKTDNLQTMMNTINYSTIGVNLSYSELKNSFSLTATATGENSKIILLNNAGNFFGTGSASKIDVGTIQNGQDALLRIDDVDVTRSSNNFTIDGLRYNLLAESATTITYRTEQDTSPTVDKVKNFIKLYNELLTTLQDALSEDYDADYQPLTDAEKEDMSDDEIAQWEKKGKTGLLRNDRSLASLLNSMRSMIYESVSGIGKSLSDIGITTGSAYSEGGKLYLDEIKLEDSLTQNPNMVMQLFTKIGTSADKTTKYEESGWIPKMIDKFNLYDKAFDKVATKKSLSDFDVRIKTMNTQLKTKEDYYYKKFATMETALASMQSQTSWLNSSGTTAS